MRPVLASLPLLALSLGLAACSTAMDVAEAPFQILAAPKVTRGIKVDQEDLKQLVIGTSTRQDAQALLGTPSAKGAFDDNTWVYMSEVTQARIGRMPGVLDQQVVELHFDDGGVLRGITEHGKDDAKDVQMVDRATPSPGTEATFMQQLLGNIGRFNPGSGRNTAASRDQL